MCHAPDFRVSKNQNGEGTLRRSFSCIVTNNLVSIYIFISEWESRNQKLNPLRSLERTSIPVERFKYSKPTTIFDFVRPTVFQIVKIVSQSQNCQRNLQRSQRLERSSDWGDLQIEFMCSNFLVVLSVYKLFSFSKKETAHCRLQTAVVPMV